MQIINHFIHLSKNGKLLIEAHYFNEVLRWIAHHFTVQLSSSLPEGNDLKATTGDHIQEKQFKSLKPKIY